VKRAVPVVFLIALAGCAALSGPYREYDIRFQGGGPPVLGESPSDEELIDATAWLIRNRLELPFPPVIKAYVYVNEATLVDGLIEVAGDSRDEAWDKGRYAAGVSARNGLFLRGDYVARMHRVARAGLFAHELAHVSQTRLREGGRSRAAQWILEGHADWVKVRVLDLLHYRSYAESRAHIARTVVGSATPIQLFPDLEELARSSDWVAATNKLGASATYCQAFLAVDWLVERYGRAKLTEFLGRFSLDSAPGEHWAKVFPISYSQFVREFRVRLENLSGAYPAVAGDSLGALQPSCG